MLIKQHLLPKKQDLFSDHTKEKVLIAKKQDLFGDSTLKKVGLIKTGFTSIKTVFTKPFFSARAQRKEKEREAFLPTEIDHVNMWYCFTNSDNQFQNTTLYLS